MKLVHKNFPLLFCLLLVCGGIRAQPIVLDKSTVLRHPFPLYLNNAAFFLDESNTRDAAAVAKQPFHPYSYYFSKSGKFLPSGKTWWMRIELQNPGPNDTTVVLYTGFQNYIHAWSVSGERVTSAGKCGNLVPASQLSIAETRQALLLRVPAAPQTQVFYISVKNITTYQVDPFRPYLMTTASLAEAQENLLRSRRIPDYLFFTGIGMFLIMLVYILIKWIYQKDTTYLWYAITIFGSTAYFFFNFIKEYNNQFIFPENPLLNLLTADSYIFISMVAYWQFVRRFLYLDKENSFLGNYLKTGSYFILIIGALSLIHSLATRNVTRMIQINSTAGVIMLCAGIYVLFAIRKVNQPLRRFIYGGIFSLILFYSLASVYEMVRDTPWEFLPELGGGTPLLMIGNIFEMLFFTIGLAYRNKLETEQMAKVSLQKAEAELTALRSQMNPHFIFNCMHTIDAYIFREQPEKASSFLNRFSKLIRQVLENSQHQLIGLDKELESLELYIRLEEERFDHSFTTKIETDRELLSQHYRIPPLLLQPYAENAILHGLRHLSAQSGRKGELRISITDEGQLIGITITDNGIGRDAAQRIKELNGKQHSGLAQELTRQRLERMGAGGNVVISDMTAHTGTIVSIHIPKIR